VDTWERVDTNKTRITGSNPAPVGKWIIQYVAIDEAGNESDTLSYYVIVNDTKTPVLNGCPAASETIYVTAGTQDCEATVPTGFTPTISGLCAGSDSLGYAYTFNGGGAITKDEGSIEGFTLPVGVYSVTYTATNLFSTAAIKTATCVFTLNVSDTLKPLITCSDYTRDADGLTYEINGAEFDPIASDNCGIASLMHNYHGGGATLADTVLTSGTYDIVWTVIDIHSNQRSCTSKLTIGDAYPPVFTVNTTPTVYLDDNGSVTLGLDSVIIHMSDNVSDSSAIVTTLSQEVFTCANIGTPVEVNFTATDEAGKFASATITVTVLDTIAPKFTLRDPIPTVYLDASGNGTLSMDSVIVTLRDNCTTDSLTLIANATLSESDFTCADIGAPITVTFSTKDAQDNFASGTFTVTVLDTLAPVFTLRNSIAYLDATGNVTLSLDSAIVTLSDNCTTDSLILISNSTLTPSVLTCADVNTPATVTYSTKDESNNTKSGTFTVTVLDTLAPVFTLRNSIA
jgi:hypothetical protein